MTFDRNVSSFLSNVKEKPSGGLLQRLRTMSTIRIGGSRVWPSRVLAAEVELRRVNRESSR
jgi:hypothetical protein